MTEADAELKAIADTWRNLGASDYEYFERYEKPELLAWFWAPDSRFRKVFEQYLDLDDVLDVASGAGRHSAQIVGRCRRLTLIDTSVDATELARKRFSSASHVTVILSPDGKSLPFEKDRFSSVFSYDSMVHFEPLTVASYILEVASVLKPGGRAILHHSNYSENPTGTFKENPDWRNFMPRGFVEHVCARAGLTIIEQQAFPWNANSKTDALTVMEKVKTRG
ncbi:MULTISPECIES: class I SAM-dependent methyltransferase [unclassified Mesorhizobium]|uniref:class I SAM-dependent methyltransferase n=2 Tax=Mesorhizobium TaxID=68287 RepID=UPI000FC9AF34|nr:MULTISPECIES: class I SAM-dependent methyltransferase [unclassified Mesorhizobium]RUW46733.1 class I SAM-dependent methyltransferase [Mesorhizobium sp. M8A.F.Ca.ET.021.01.1.1]TGP95460.1 class I SAM-dependent methyltransferase [Mesorhizobium sp. M8A.F.Ca.ET.218.01.1.1]TGT18516.1 class I SAM-dependent methyltransferase [Mesorhizobium sp. M8A.F.Ca.ET.213.01.1.1]TGT89532.1 class I SAM-dependent methyltransferase [Mesorhizobium sp. M8A.F.Ca.ET.161.01.1.1]TGV42090.1 class I SAM-dependent methyltr